MAEENVDVCNNINQYEGLESLFIESLPKCEFKSDVVIVVAHYLLTQELDYEYAEIQDELDENGEEKKIYRTMNSLPAHWRNNLRSYKLIYKTEKETRILTAQRNNREFVLYFSQEGFEKNKYSSNIILKNYIPDQYMRSNDLSLIQNLSELRVTLLKFFSLEDKIKAKHVHDTNLIGNTYSCQYQSKSPMKVIPGISNDHNWDPCSHPLRNIRGTANPLMLGKTQETTEHIGKFQIRDDKNDKPIDRNKISTVFENDPDYVMVEDPVGPPDESYIK